MQISDYVAPKSNRRWLKHHRIVEMNKFIQVLSLFLYPKTMLPSYMS